MKTNTKAVTGSTDGKERKCRADRKPSVLQMACTGQGLLATACCCTEPCSPSIFHPRTRHALIGCCSQPKLCHGWAGTEGEASPALFFWRCWLCQTLALAVTITSQVTGGSRGRCLGQCFCYGTCKLGTLGP